MLQRTAQLWAGLRRVYFGEVEDPTDSNDDEPRPRTRQSVMDFKAEIADIRARIRRRAPRFPDDLNLPPPRLPRSFDDDPGDGPPSFLPILSASSETNDESMFEQTPSGVSSNGEEENTIGNDNSNLFDSEDSMKNGRMILVKSHPQT
jgi:hypothetical protein